MMRAVRASWSFSSQMKTMAPSPECQSVTHHDVADDVGVVHLDDLSRARVVAGHNPDGVALRPARRHLRGTTRSAPWGREDPPGCPRFLPTSAAAARDAVVGVEGAGRGRRGPRPIRVTSTPAANHLSQLRWGPMTQGPRSPQSWYGAFSAPPSVSGSQRREVSPVDHHGVTLRTVATSEAGTRG